MRVAIVGAYRTPIGALGGSLASLTAPQLGSIAIAAALKQSTVPAKEVDEVYFGNVLQAGVGQAPARQAALGAGLPPTVCCTTINKVCASGMKAVTLGAASIRNGDAEVVVAGGMESMSNAPFLLPEMRFGRKFGDAKAVDHMGRDGLRDAYTHKPMGDCAEICAKEETFSREEQDAYAARSFDRALKAQASGKFKAEICPVTIKGRAGPVVIDKDEVKATTLETLKKLKPVFNPAVSVTAGSSSTINDGASALVLMSEERAKKRGIPILGIIRGWADAETDPDHFTIAPSFAMPKAMAKAGVKVSDVDFFEINEAFAVVALANMKRLGLDPNKVNVYGGGVSLGHPIGNSGSRIIVTLLNVLNQEGGKIGVAGICNGGGGASSIVIERASTGSKL